MKFYPILTVLGLSAWAAIGLNHLLSTEAVFGQFTDGYLDSIDLAADPDNGECLTTDGTDNSWDTCAAGGGSDSPITATTSALADTQVIYGTGTSTIGSEAAFTYDDATDKLTTVNASTTQMTSSDDAWFGRRLTHDGDEDTYQQYATNQWSLYAGGVNALFVDGDQFHVNSTGDTGFNFHIHAGADDLLVADNDSNSVGIGTSSPGARLGVQGKSGGTIFSLLSHTGTKFMEMLNTGVTNLKGTWDASTAYLKLRTEADPAISATSSVAVNSASSSVHFYDGAAEQVLSPYFDKSFELGSTTQDNMLNSFAAGTTTRIIWCPDGKVTLEKLHAIATSTGSVLVRAGDGTNWTEDIRATTSGVEDESLSNNTFNDRECVRVQAGSQVSNPNGVTVTATFRKTP